MSGSAIVTKDKKFEWCSGPAKTRCGKCGALPVCSKACLTNFWPEHKRVCQKQTAAGGADVLAHQLR